MGQISKKRREERQQWQWIDDHFIEWTALTLRASMLGSRLQSKGCILLNWDILVTKTKTKTFEKPKLYKKTTADLSLEN